jgi:hypothetical protein
VSRLVHGLEIKGRHYRVVADGCWRTLEVCEKDALGDTRWVTVDNFNATNDQHSTVKIFIAMLDDLAEKRDAVAASMTMPPGQ